MGPRTRTLVLALVCFLAFESSFSVVADATRIGDVAKNEKQRNTNSKKLPSSPSASLAASKDKGNSNSKIKSKIKGKEGLVRPPSPSSRQSSSGKGLTALVSKPAAKANNHSLEEGSEDGKREETEDKANEDGEGTDAEEGANKEDEDDEKNTIMGLAKKEDEGKKPMRRAAIFLVVCLVISVGFGVGAYFITKANYDSFDKGTEGNEGEYSFGRFLGSDYMLPYQIAVGMTSGLVFGFIDNAGLFFGMEFLEPLFEKILPWTDDPRVLAGWGNTFSDLLGSFLGTFAGVLVEQGVRRAEGKDFKEGYPIWTEAAGITVGCVIGVIIPKLIMRNPSKKLVNEEERKAIAAGMTPEKLKYIEDTFDKLNAKFDPDHPDAVALSSLLHNTPPDLDPIFMQADVNKDGWVTKDEVIRAARLSMELSEKFRKNDPALPNLVKTEDMSPEDGEDTGEDKDEGEDKDKEDEGDGM